MFAKKSMLFVGYNCNHIRNFASKSKSLEDALSIAINKGDLNSFKYVITECKFRSVTATRLKTNQQPILIDLCNKLAKVYAVQPHIADIYRHMLEQISDMITPWQYCEHVEGKTALMLLASINEPKVAWFLNKMLSNSKSTLRDVAVGIDGTSNRGHTHYCKDIPLIYATQQRSYHGVLILLRNGANPNLKDANKKTALDYALKNNDHNVVELLKSSGAYVRIGVFPRGF